MCKTLTGKGAEFSDRRRYLSEDLTRLFQTALSEEAHLTFNTVTGHSGNAGCKQIGNCSCFLINALKDSSTPTPLPVPKILSSRKNKKFGVSTGVFHQLENDNNFFSFPRSSRTFSLFGTHSQIAPVIQPTYLQDK